MLKINELIITQHGLRNEDQLPSMIEFVRAGGIFSKDQLSPPGPIISITRFEDGRLFIQDGHHRACAIILGGRDFLHEDEHQLDNWTYDEYREINFDNGWVTPYDPRWETRHPDYALFKRSVKDRLHDRDKASQFIAQNRQMYCSDRQLHKVDQLIFRYCLQDLL